MGHPAATMYPWSAQISGLILSGPLAGVGRWPLPTAAAFRHHCGRRGAALRVARIPFDWLARDRQVVDRFRDDPLVFHGRFTVRMAAEILRAMKNVSEKAGFVERTAVDLAR